MARLAARRRAERRLGEVGRGPLGTDVHGGDVPHPFRILTSFTGGEREHRGTDRQHHRGDHRDDETSRTCGSCPECSRRPGSRRRWSGRRCSWSRAGPGSREWWSSELLLEVLHGDPDGLDGRVRGGDPPGELVERRVVPRSGRWRSTPRRRHRCRAPTCGSRGRCTRVRRRWSCRARCRALRAACARCRPCPRAASRRRSASVWRWANALSSWRSARGLVCACIRRVRSGAEAVEQCRHRECEQHDGDDGQHHVRGLATPANVGLQPLGRIGSDHVSHDVGHALLLHESVNSDRDRAVSSWTQRMASTADTTSSTSRTR